MSPELAPESGAAVGWLAVLARDDVPPEQHDAARRALYFYNAPDLLPAIQAFCRSAHPTERAAGAEALRDLARPGHPLTAAGESELLHLLARETEAMVLSCAAAALQRYRGPGVLPALLALARHPDGETRLGVTIGLLYRREPEATACLLELSQDEDVEVRDWATFALGTLCGQDSPAIRGALLRRLEDPDRETRREAMRGLALRREARLVPYLRARLANGATGEPVDEDLLDAVRLWSGSQQRPYDAASALQLLDVE